MEHLTFSGKQFTADDHFVNQGGSYLYCQHWCDSEKPRFLVLILHGYGSHGGRFKDLASGLAKIGGYIFVNDYEGFGESEGNRGLISDFQSLITDAVQHIKLKKSLFPNTPLFLCGQSMGGALAVLTSQQHPDLVDGIITLSGMLAVPQDLTPWYKRKAVAAAAFAFPSLTVASLDNASDSRDKEQCEIARNDKLKINTLKAGMTLQLLRIGEAVEKAIPSFNLPFIAFHGNCDAVCDLAVSQNFYDKLQSQQKTFKMYKDCYHDLLHELPPTSDNVLSDISSWIESRIQQN